MSVSSGSDITIPIQDSPPPPPSPYGNSKQPSNANTTTASNKGTGSRKGSIPNAAAETKVTGIDNVAYQQSESNRTSTQDANNTNNSKRKSSKHTTMVDMNGGTQQHNKGTSTTPTGDGPINEAINGEVINMSVLDSIPHKPQAEFGPYENFDEYFIAVNQHKKFLRGEKLYVTKDKRKSSHCKKYTCWLFGALVLAGIITMSVLAAVGLLPPKSAPTASRTMITTARTTPQLPEGVFTSSEFSSSSESDFMTVSPPTSDSSSPAADFHVPQSAEVHLTLTDAVYEDALSDPSSEQYQRLANSIETELKNLMETEGGLNTSHVRVMEFSQGSVVAKLRIGWMDRSKDLPYIQRFINEIHSIGGYTVKPGIPSYAVLNSCNMDNNGCSHFCAFDYDSLDFLCTCPERLQLGVDNKTCEEPEPSEQPGSSPAPSSEEVEPAVVPELTTTTTTLALAPVDISTESQPPALPPSEEPIQPEVTAEPSAEVESSSSPADQEPAQQEILHPAHEESTPSAQTPQSSEENVSSANDTASAPADFDNTENVEAIVPEVSQQHHENEPLITLVTTTSSSPEMNEEVTAAPVEPAGDTNEPSVEVSEEQVPETPTTTTTTTTTMIPGIVSDAVMTPSEPSVIPDEDHAVATTLPPSAGIEPENQPSHESGEVVTTIDITPRNDDPAPTSQPAADSQDVNSLVEIVPGVGEQRNSSVTRALLKNYETVEEVSNSQEEQPQPLPQDEEIATTPSPQPEINSNEFMAFSDANMSLVNAHLTSKTPELVQEVTEEVPSSASIETMTSYETHHEGPDASVSGEDHPSFDEQLILDEILTTTTVKPFNLVNDTAVNHMTEGITENLQSSEVVTTVPPQSQAVPEIEGVTEVPSPSNGESRELAQDSNEDQRVVSAEVEGAGENQPSDDEAETTTVHPHVHELSQTIAGFISHTIKTTPIPSSAETREPEPGPQPQQPSIVSTTIDILSRLPPTSTPTPPPNPYDVLSNTFSRTNSSDSVAGVDNVNNSNDDNDSQLENNSGNELE